MTEKNDKIIALHIILTVTDLQKSKNFYRLLFELDPLVDEDNIVEFELFDEIILGLQSEELKMKIFDKDIYERFRHTKTGGEELYLVCNKPEYFHKRALQLGCLELSPFQLRNWGDKVAYSVNHDGHILAFACK